MSNSDHRRVRQVSQQVHRFLARTILRDINDPRIQNVELTGVDMTSDCKQATVYYVLLDQRSPDDDAQKGLESAADYMKHRISEALPLKFVPELFFQYDESIERGRRIESLLEDL